jgi:hypothetical protein
MEERSLEVNAAPEAAWRLWSDTATWPDWNPDVLSVNLDGPLAVGASGTMTTTTRTHPIRIVGVEQGRSFQLEARVIPLTRFEFRCEVTPLSGDSCRISQCVTVKGPASILLARPMSRQIAATFPPILEGLKTAAERPAAVG